MLVSAVPNAADTLAIAYAFTPYKDTSAVVAAKRIAMAGRPVDLIQNAMDEIRGKDPASELICQPLLRRRAILPTRTKFGAWGSIVEFCEAGLAQIEEWERDGAAYRRMYSRAHFIASHFLAALYKIRHPEIEWEAEFSDTLSRNGVGELRLSDVRLGAVLDELRYGIVQHGGTPPESTNVYVWGEYATLALADRLLFTNQAQHDFVLALYPDDDPIVARAKDRAVIAPHPSPLEVLYGATPSAYRLDPAVCNIAYFGNFYASQQPVAILQPFTELAPEDRMRLRLHVFTGATADLARLVEELGLTDTVLVNERLPYLEFLNLSRKMDVLLAVDAKRPPGQTHNPVLLSKWSDYVGAGTPVWAIVEEGSELDGKEVAHRSPLGHQTAALQVLTRLSRQHQLAATSRT